MIWTADVEETDCNGSVFPYSPQITPRGKFRGFCESACKQQAGQYLPYTLLFLLTRVGQPPLGSRASRHAAGNVGSRLLTQCLTCA